MAAKRIQRLVLLKLIQLNIWQGKILKNVMDFLQDQDADVVCLQEVFSSQQHIDVLDMLDSLETIQARLAYPHFYYEPTFRFEITGVKAQIGNAILSKQPLVNRRVVFTSHNFHEVTDWNQNYSSNTRNALIAEIQLGDKNLTVVTHHGYREPTPIGSQTSINAMQKLVEVTRNISTPLIIAGDLNVSAKSPVMSLFEGWLQDLTEKYSINDTLTQFGKVRKVPCDHILVSDGIVIQNFIVSEELVSDHKPLIVEFEF
jgi:endonuclease/exonuclease/phosphatase family metal-dependent hydrolase